MNMKVLTDEKWILFVIEQILSNSLKYTKKGYIKIYTEKPKTLVIEDSGIGIAPEDIKRIGEKRLHRIQRPHRKEVYRSRIISVY